MKKQVNRRWEMKLIYGYGRMTSVFLSHDIKEYRYMGVPLMRWYASEDKLLIFDYNTQVSGEDKRFYFRWYHHTPSTIKYKYNSILPPAMAVIGRRGRLGGYYVLLTKDGKTPVPNPMGKDDPNVIKVPLEHGMVVPFKGIL